MAHVDEKCKQCGRAFKSFNKSRPVGDPFRWKVFCSKQCYNDARRESKESFHQSVKPCEQCGEPFGPGNRKQSEFAKRRFCSDQCCTDAQKNTIEDLLLRAPVVSGSGCHIWTGHRTGNDYGVSRLAGRMVLVHRAVWEHYRGPIPPELQIDHTCGAKLCCNVDHLRLVTARENSLAATSNNMAARNHRRIKCPLCGGPYSAFPNGIRYCKPCRHKQQMKYQREYRAAKRNKQTE